MKDSKSGCDCVKNVGCQVTNCKYHGLLNRCTAEQITVQNENATFTPPQTRWFLSRPM